MNAKSSSNLSYEKIIALAENGTMEEVLQTVLQQNFPILHSVYSLYKSPHVEEQWSKERLFAVMLLALCVEAQQLKELCERLALLQPPPPIIMGPSYIAAGMEIFPVSTKTLNELK